LIRRNSEFLFKFEPLKMVFPLGELFFALQ
jgi:hypothetical protein